MPQIRAQIFFRNNRSYKVGTIAFDLLVSEAHNFSNQITSHNVEEGSEITDHIKNNLESGSLAGFISNFSLKVPGLITNRAQTAYEEMKDLWRTESLVTIVTVMEVYENVAIASVDVERSEDTGEAIVLNISFRKVKIVKLKTVQVDVAVSLKDMKTSINRLAAPSTDLGRTVGETI